MWTVMCAMKVFSLLYVQHTTSPLYCCLRLRFFPWRCGAILIPEMTFHPAIHYLAYTQLIVFFHFGLGSFFPAVAVALLDTHSCWITFYLFKFVSDLKAEFFFKSIKGRLFFFFFFLKASAMVNVRKAKVYIMLLSLFPHLHVLIEALNFM